MKRLIKMTKLKACPLALMILLLTAALCACDQADNTSEPQDEPDDGEGLTTAAVIFDFSCGSAEENLIWETEYSYDEIAAEDLIESLGRISGLDFFASVTLNEDGGAVVDWAADSTLIAGLDDREQKADFHFFDADSLRWFMMDSMYRTLQNHLGADEIYYTMNGGNELAFDELFPVNVFPSDIPYMGSAFYFAHS
jgi:hypothetical protein